MRLTQAQQVKSVLGLSQEEREGSEKFLLDPRGRLGETEFLICIRKIMPFVVFLRDCI